MQVSSAIAHSKTQLIRIFLILKSTELLSVVKGVSMFAYVEMSSDNADSLIRTFDISRNISRIGREIALLASFHFYAIQTK